MSQLNKQISKRDFLKFMGAIIAFLGIGGLTQVSALFKKSPEVSNSGKKASGYGTSGYGV